MSDYGSDLDDDTIEMMQELEEKENQLRLAAEFGQSLLERTEELQEQNVATEREKEELQTALQEHEFRIQELSDNAAMLSEESAAKDAQLAATQAELDAKVKALEEATTNITGDVAENSGTNVPDTSGEYLRQLDEEAKITNKEQRYLAEIKRLEAEKKEAEASLRAASDAVAATNGERNMEKNTC